MTINPERIPVIIGVGQINDRTNDPATAMDPIQLMAAALRLADADAGGGWLARLDSLNVVEQIAFAELNPVVDAVALAIGADPAHRFQTASPNGDSPTKLLNEAANRIGAGEARVVAVVGAEALRAAAQRLAAGADSEATLAERNVMRARHVQRAPSYRRSYGLTAPVDVYPLYENATRAAWGQTLAEGQAESGAIWSLFSQVAAGNPAAWLRAAKSAEEITTASPGNRPIAFPYTKLMVANSSVNQGAGFIVTSLFEARAAGIAAERLIYVGHGAGARETEDVLARDRFDRSASMAVSLEQTLSSNVLSIDQIDHVELYSCFPCIPKMARRIIGWPVEKPASVVGGLTFGGGPIGNYMSHAVAAMVERLRGTGETGLLFGNGGFATHNHSIIVSNRPIAGAAFPKDFDCQPLAEVRRLPVPPIDEDYAGPGRIESYTVLFDREGAVRQGVILARNPAGARFLARILPENTLDLKVLMAGNVEPVSMAGMGARAADGLLDWIMTGAVQKSVAN